VEKAGEFAQKQVRLCKDVNEPLLIKCRIVNVCIPNDLHREFAIKVAEAGKHVVVEKPLGVTPKRWDNIIRATGENRVKLSIIFQNRKRWYKLYILHKEDEEGQV